MELAIKQICVLGLVLFPTNSIIGMGHLISWVHNLITCKTAVIISALPFKFFCDSNEMKDDFKSWTLDKNIRQQLKQPQMLGLNTVCNYE